MHDSNTELDITRMIELPHGTHQTLFCYKQKKRSHPTTDGQVFVLIPSSELYVFGRLRTKSGGVRRAHVSGVGIDDV